MGGAAVSILGRARFTEDVDAVFLLSNKDLLRLLEMAREEGQKTVTENLIKSTHSICFIVQLFYDCAACLQDRVGSEQ